MGRLIDADKLKDEYRDDTQIGNALRMLVDMQPTAYDVYNVVEKLEEAIADTTDTETGLGAR